MRGRSCTFATAHLVVPSASSGRITSMRSRSASCASSHNFSTLVHPDNLTLSDSVTMWANLRLLAAQTPQAAVTSPTLNPKP